MDDAGLVCCLQRFRDLARHRHGLIERDRAACDALGERFALDELHDQGSSGVEFLYAVNLGNMRMIQRSKRLRLTGESRNPIDVRRKCLGKDLEGDVPVETSVARPIDLAHPTGAERRRDLKDADPCPGNEGHECGTL